MRKLLLEIKEKKVKTKTFSKITRVDKPGASMQIEPTVPEKFDIENVFT